MKLKLVLFAGLAVVGFALAANAGSVQDNDLYPNPVGDGVPDDFDNCVETQNANQIDTNGDGFGNACDPDLNQDLVVDVADFGIFFAAYSGTPNPDADFNDDGVTDVADFGVFFAYYSPSNPNFGPAPGPSCCAP
jgi:hypothetical protein